MSHTSLEPRLFCEEKESLAHTMSVHAPKFPEILGIQIKYHIYYTRVLNVNYPLHYCLFQFNGYLSQLLVSALTETLYFCLGKAPEPVLEAETSRDKNKT